MDPQWEFHMAAFLRSYTLFIHMSFPLHDAVTIAPFADYIALLSAADTAGLESSRKLQTYLDEGHMDYQMANLHKPSKIHSTRCTANYL
jgi:hypothetical protein